MGNAMATPHRPPIEDPSHQDPLFSASYLAKQYRHAWRNRDVNSFPASLRANADLRREHWRVISKVTPGSALTMLQVFGARFLTKRHLPMILPRQSGNEHYLRYLAEHAPNRDSRVFLCAERDAFGLPRLTARPGFSEVDYTTVVELHRAIAERLDNTQTGRLAFDEAEVRGQVDAQITHFNSGAHHLGTTRMSATPGGGVVDANCKVHDVDDLFIAGGSVFVTSGCANPTLTIVAFAVRLAAHLRQRLTQQAVMVTSSPH